MGAKNRIREILERELARAAKRLELHEKYGLILSHAEQDEVFSRDALLRDMARLQALIDSHDAIISGAP